MLNVSYGTVFIVSTVNVLDPRADMMKVFLRKSDYRLWYGKGFDAQKLAADPNYGSTISDRVKLRLVVYGLRQALDRYLLDWWDEYASVANDPNVYDATAESQMNLRAIGWYWLVDVFNTALPQHLSKKSVIDSGVNAIKNRIFKEITQSKNTQWGNTYKTYRAGAKAWSDNLYISQVTKILWKPN